MSARLVAAAVAVLVAFPAFAQALKGDVVIRTRDGKVRMGRVLSETSRGFLLSSPEGTEVVEFASIVDVRALAEAPAPQPQVRPQAPARPAYAPQYAAPQYAAPQYAAPQPEYAVTPQYAAPQQQPPPQYVAQAPVHSAPAPSEAQWGGQPVGVSAEAAPSVGDWMKHREGFKLGVGAFVGGGSGHYSSPSGSTALRFEIDWTFGRTGVRVSPELLIYNIGAYTWVGGGVDSEFHVNVAKHYAFGVGLRGALVSGANNALFVGLSLTPAIIKLGDSGQHQLTLTVTVPFLAGWSGYAPPFTGPWGSLGYSYLF